jgi:hypothetical protein
MAVRRLRFIGPDWLVLVQEEPSIDLELKSDDRDHLAARPKIGCRP